MYNLGHLGLYKNIPKKRIFNPTPNYERDSYTLLQYKSHLRNEFLIPLKANGDGSGVATIRLQSLETQSVKITGNGKFYTDSAGTTVQGVESTIGTTLGNLYVKVPAGDSCYLVCGKADKLSGLGSISTNVIEDGNNIPYINYCAINYPLINLSVIRFAEVLNSSFTGSIDNLTNLTQLNITNNLLTALTGSVDNTPNLRYLLITNNLLTALTGSIDNTPNLTQLNITNNLLSSFTGSVDNTPNLRYLLITNNLLTALTGSIDNTPNLTYLNITNNLLTALTGSIDNTPNLMYLLITNNLLTALTGDIGKLVKCYNFRSHINTNCTFTYVTRRSDWTSAYNTLWVSCSSMTSAMVDNLLIDLDASGARPTGDKIINLNGLCGAVTSASAAARASLVSKGFRVVVNT